MSCHPPHAAKTTAAISAVPFHNPSQCKWPTQELRGGEETDKINNNRVLSGGPLEVTQPKQQSDLTSGSHSVKKTLGFAEFRFPLTAKLTNPTTSFCQENTHKTHTLLFGGHPTVTRILQLRIPGRRDKILFHYFHFGLQNGPAVPCTAVSHQGAACDKDALHLVTQAETGAVRPM